jgi:WhiB family transcriptional regulator, redox-sensing transcriptional regulator
MWRDMAACSGMDTNIFFSQDQAATGEPERISLAKRVCSGCPVRNDCLDYALKINDAWGLLGGLTPQERRRK